MASHIEHRGLRCGDAENGRVALERLISAPPDLIFSTSLCRKWTASSFSSNCASNSAFKAMPVVVGDGGDPARKTTGA